MFFLLGPIAVLAFFGALEIVSRLFGLSLSIFGALGAVLRQTDEPRLQRRQALTLLLFVAGLIAFGGGVFYLLAGTLSQAIFTTIGIGALLLTLAGYIGSRTLRAIGRSAQRLAQQSAETAKK
ncbi:MAG: hypothetical protein K8U03_22070 [Planctomycetia bacterium]|nr:hypothetical protein [Planctomycetia bacterium]